MSNNEYDEYRRYEDERKERERYAKARQELDDYNAHLSLGFMAAVIALFVGAIAFFVRHPKIAILLILISLSPLFLMKVSQFAVSSFYTAYVDGEMIDVRKGPAYLPDSKVNRADCEARINKAIKDGKLEVLESVNSFEFLNSEKSSWLRYVPAYDILNVADTYMTKLDKRSLSAKINPYKIVLADSLSQLQEEGKVPESVECESDERGYYIDKNNEIVYVWCFGKTSSVDFIQSYEKLRYINGDYDLQFLKDWVNIVCSDEINQYNNDMDWLMICKDSLKTYIEKRENAENLINDFYSKEAELKDDVLSRIEKIDDGSITPTVDTLKEIVGGNSYRDFLIQTLVNEPYCAEQYPDEMYYYDHDITDWGDEYENSPYLKLLIAKYNAYDRLFPGEVGDDGVHPGNSEEEYQRILELRDPLVNELNARIDRAFEEEPTRRWYDLIDEADLDELITHYDMTVMHNEKYNVAKEVVSKRVMTLTSKNFYKQLAEIAGIILVTIIICSILKNIKKKKRKQAVM